MLNGVSQETINLVKQALKAGNVDLAKSITIATGLVAYDLQAPAKNLYPTITPLRNSIPRVTRKNPGDASHWKVISALTGSGWDAMGWVPEGQRSARMAYTTANKSATYVTLGEEDQISFEASAAAEGFEDVNASITMRLLQKTMRKEEIGILAGNASLALGTVGTITTSASGAAGTLPTATYSVICVALTLEGYRNSSVSLAGVATSKVITGADGQTFTLNGGSSMKSAAASQAITLGQVLFASVVAINGAVAYAWYIGVGGGNEVLQAITPINSLAQSVPLVAGTQNATAVTADCSKNINLAFDGLLTSALNAGGGYVNSRATGVAGTGTKLTASGRGSVNEIDDMLQNMWDVNRVSPTVIYVNSQQQRDITTACLNSSSGPLLKFDAPVAPGQPYAIVAGGVVEYYYNPFSVTGGTKIPVKVHPDLAPGTILGYCERLPEWYQSNEVPNVAEMLCRRDYYRMDWPLRTRQREYGVYCEEVLAVYAPFAMGVISNIGPG